MQSLNPPRFQRGFAEMAKIEGDDFAGSGLNGRGQDVAVFFMVAALREMLFITLDGSFREGPSDFTLPIAGEVWRPCGLQLVNLSPADFLQNCVRPKRHKNLRALGELQKEIAKAEVGQHAGIEDRGFPVHSCPA